MARKLPASANAQNTFHSHYNGVIVSFIVMESGKQCCPLCHVQIMASEQVGIIVHI